MAVAVAVVVVRSCFFSGTKALLVQVPAKTNLELPNATAQVIAPEESKAEHDRTTSTAPLKTHRGRTEPGQHSGDTQT